MVKLSTLPSTPASPKVRLVRNAEEIVEAQRLRFDIFYKEYGARPDNEEIQRLERDFDRYDDYADHLVVTDTIQGEDVIVGTYRLLQQDAAERCGEFYSSSEFDISCLLNSGKSVLELGRSCVLPAYRTRPVLNLLWQGIADYITEHNIDLMFGCASLHTIQISEIEEQLSYMHHNHLSPKHLRPRALDDRYVDMDIIPAEQINVKRAFASLPPIIKGYLRLGGTIGDGAVIDEQFNTTDVCVIVQTHLLTQRYRNHYERKIQRSIPGQRLDESSDSVADSL
jgi:putative hemolysin